MKDSQTLIYGETITLMKYHDLDKDVAERVQEIMDEYGLNEDEAIELEEEI